MATIAPPTGSSELPVVDLKPLLQRLWPLHPTVTADEIADAVSYFFTNQVSDVQAGSLLMCLHFTGLDRQADVLAKCAAAMRQAAATIPYDALRDVVIRKGQREGGYNGGLCDIVGTGGDSHNTFNISTTSSILASSQLLLSKHGNRASTSKSGSADLLAHMGPRAPAIAAVSPATLPAAYAASNYAFLFAPVFHPGMRHVAPIRRQLPWRTLFNLLGPLASPVETALEARLIGVARCELGPVFADALVLGCARKALVVCGAEELDEISCAGPTLCWWVRQAPAAAATVGKAAQYDHFTLTPEDFGLPRHPLADVSPGREPAQNAEILGRLLRGEMSDDDPILTFVLMNTAALFVVSGICDAETSNLGEDDDGAVVTERGPGGGRWKEGVRRARWAVKSGAAWKQWNAYVEVTNSFPA